MFYIQTNIKVQKKQMTFNEKKNIDFRLHIHVNQTNSEDMIALSIEGRVS